MKSKKQKHEEALVRLEASEYVNSKAFRTGSATKVEWQAAKVKRLKTA
jgi:hypothetical protein